MEKELFPYTPPSTKNPPPHPKTHPPPHQPSTCSPSDGEVTVAVMMIVLENKNSFPFLRAAEGSAVSDFGASFGACGTGPGLDKGLLGAEGAGRKGGCQI